MMTGRNTLLRDNPKQLFAGPPGAGTKAMGRTSCYLPHCQVSSLYTSSEIDCLHEESHLQINSRMITLNTAMDGY